MSLRTFLQMAAAVIFGCCWRYTAKRAFHVWDRFAKPFGASPLLTLIIGNCRFCPRVFGRRCAKRLLPLALPLWMRQGGVLIPVGDAPVPRLRRCLGY